VSGLSHNVSSISRAHLATRFCPLPLCYVNSFGTLAIDRPQAQSSVGATWFGSVADTYFLLLPYRLGPVKGKLPSVRPSPLFRHKSHRNRPCVTSVAGSRSLAAMTAHLTGCGVRPASRISCRSCNTRRSLACRSGGSSPISSRKSVPACPNANFLPIDTDARGVFEA
jgi:hypothetical protein